jgi:hypothetical protein
MYDVDEYGVIINGEGTYAQAVDDLKKTGTVVLSWGDQDGTLLQIMLSYNPPRLGYKGGLIDYDSTKLWVGIAGYNAYAFTVGLSQELVPVYIAEKFGMRGENPTTVKLAEMLTAIRRRLSE